jgi:hypothetical protein
MSEELGAQALAFAKHYVALVDALMKEGVPEPVARDEARMTALMMLFGPEEESERCPLCGRGASS